MFTTLTEPVLFWAVSKVTFFQAVEVAAGEDRNVISPLLQQMRLRSVHSFLRPAC